MIGLSSSGRNVHFGTFNFCQAKFPEIHQLFPSFSHPALAASSILEVFRRGRIQLLVPAASHRVWQRRPRTGVRALLLGLVAPVDISGQWLTVAVTPCLCLREGLISIRTMEDAMARLTRNLAEQEERDQRGRRDRSTANWLTTMMVLMIWSS